MKYLHKSLRIYVTLAIGVKYRNVNVFICIEKKEEKK